MQKLLRVRHATFQGKGSGPAPLAAACLDTQEISWLGLAVLRFAAVLGNASPIHHDCMAGA